MYDTPLKITHQGSSTNSAGAMLVTLVGFVAAFAVASIQALPLVLSAMGLPTNSIADLGYLAAEHRTLLMFVGGIGLAAGGGLLWLQQQAVQDSYDRQLEASPAVRAITFAGLVLGTILLLAAGAC